MKIVIGLAAVSLAAFSYEAGRTDLLAGLVASPDTSPRYIQIGNDTPGQAFAIVVDELSADVTLAADPQASDETSCSSPSSIKEAFEEGDFPKDAFVGVANDGKAAVQQTLKREGNDAARISSTDSKGSYAYVRFGVCGGTGLDVSADFWVDSEGGPSGNVPLFRVFRQDGTRVLSVYRQNGSSRLFVQIGDKYQQTIARFPLHTWSNISVHASYPRGTIKLVELIMDGQLVYTSGH